MMARVFGEGAYSESKTRVIARPVTDVRKIKILEGRDQDRVMAQPRAAGQDLLPANFLSASVCVKQAAGQAVLWPIWVVLGQPAVAASR